MTNTRTLKNDNKLFSWGIALICCTLIFIAIELKYPYFFLRDDNADSYLPEYIYGINSISEGKFPMFCFNTYAGQRFFAGGQNGIFNPIVYFAYSASMLFSGKPDMMMDILAYISILIGCTGAFFLLKKLGCSDTPAIIGSIAWNFYCYNIWEGSSWIIVLYTTSVFPFFLLTSLLLLERFSIRNLILATIPRVYMVYLGHPQFFIFGAIFDCIFIGMLCLIKTTKGSKLRTLLRLIRDYAIVYVSTTLLSLPLLIPEYEYTQITYSNSSARTMENILIEMGFDKPAFYVPFLYTEDNVRFFYPPFIGYLLIAFVFIGFVILYLRFMKDDIEEIKNPANIMRAVLPCLIIGYLLLFSRETLELIWYVPILNRFQYYHRLCIFFAAFAIIFGCMSMTAIGDILKRKLKNSDRVMPVIAVVVVLIEFLTFGLLYTTTPHLGRGPCYDTSKTYDYEFASKFTGGRYVTMGYVFDPGTVNSARYDLSENLNYNLSKLYNINNISGYTHVLNYSDVANYNYCFLLMVDIQGGLYGYYPGVIEEMRTHSVCWYIVNPAYDDICAPYLEYYGLKRISETSKSVIYHDPYAEPYAFDFVGNPVEVTQDVNSLIITPDENYPGGFITLNYTYDPNFRCYVDGNPVPIYNDPQNWQFKVECPAGEHEVIVQYEDFTFTICSIIAGEYIIFAGGGILLYKQLKKKKSAKPAV
jgi:hypothetical protein